LTGFGLFGLPSLTLKLLGDGSDIPPFGNETDDKIHYIYDLLKEIAGVYIYYVNSYNAYKHGHRVWYGYNLTTQRSNSLFYIEKKNKPSDYKMDFVPLDDNVICDYIMPCSRNCQKLFQLILNNNRSIKRSEEKDKRRNVDNTGKQ
jgi:hypothetical protein